jgi:hypothetical protein
MESLVSNMTLCNIGVIVASMYGEATYMLEFNTAISMKDVIFKSNSLQILL